MHPRLPACPSSPVSVNNSLFHVTPLHYLPHILQDGALYSQSVLAGHAGITARTTARRRDRMLGLADYVHLSLSSETPLLADKLAKGYPHALLVFDRAGILALPQTALLPYNTKAWHAKADFAPVTDRAEQAALLRRHTEEGRYPSLEVLVKYGLDLHSLTEIVFLTSAEHALCIDLLSALGISATAPLRVDAGMFPPCAAYKPVTMNALASYFAACAEAGTLLAPPAIPFD